MSCGIDRWPIVACREDGRLWNKCVGNRWRRGENLKRMVHWRVYLSNKCVSNRWRRGKRFKRMVHWRVYLSLNARFNTGEPINNAEFVYCQVREDSVIFETL